MSLAQDANRGRPGLSLVRLVSLMSIVAVALWMRWGWALWSLPDLKVYVLGGEAVIHGTPVYDVLVQAGPHTTLRFTYPPFAALVFTPFALAPSWAPWLMGSLSVVAYGLGGWACQRACGTPVWTAAAILLVGAVTEPVQRTLVFGQVNLVLLAVVLADLFLVPRRWRGWLIGVAAGIKLVPVLLVLHFVLRRELGMATRVVASFAATVTFAWLVLPSDSARFWFGELFSGDRFGVEARLWNNQSLSALLHRAAETHWGSGLGASALTVVALLAAFVLTVMATRRQLGLGDQLAAASSVGLGGLLLSPISWTHHWVWVIPVLFVVARRRWWWAFGGTTALFFLPPMWALSGRPDEQLGYSPTDLVLSSAFCLWGVVVLIAFTLGAPRSDETQALQRRVQMNETASV